LGEEVEGSKVEGSKVEGSRVEDSKVEDSKVAGDVVEDVSICVEVGASEEVAEDAGGVVVVVGISSKVHRETMISATT
jgi:hypothetical protein